MKAIKNNLMEHHQNSTGGVSLLTGFVLAMFNHIFGWLNAITTTGQMNPFVQALVMGFIGATVSYFTNKFWKFIIEKKTKK